MKSRFAYWFFRLRSALRWYLGASTRYDVHSPFLNTFVREVWRDDRYYHAFGIIGKIRKMWRGRGGRVQLRADGAPSKTTTKTSRTISSLVATNAIADRQGRLLFRLVLWCQPPSILEFGTNAGISTLYLHAADTRARLDTVEANPEVMALARQTLAAYGDTPNVHPHTQLFRDFTPPHAGYAPDLFFLDGDHRYQSTLDYVRRFLPHAKPTAIFVIADIHWSPGMERAWAELRRLPRVTASVDLYHFGLLFFRPELRGPHLTLIPTRWKPWRVGFFG